MSFIDPGTAASGRNSARNGLMNGSAMTPPEGMALPPAPGGPMAGALPAVAPPSGERPQPPAMSPIHRKLLDWADPRKTKNIADELSEEELARMGDRVMREYTIDDNSRSEWLAKNKDALNLAMQVAEEKSYPWPKASNMIYPLVSTAAIQFAARAYPAIVSDRNVVKGIVYGDDNGEPEISPQDGTPMVRVGPDGQPQPVWRTPPGAKRERADRVGSHMSYQLLNIQKEWDSDTDRLLHILPIAGCHFRKSFYDPVHQMNISTLASAKDVVINYWAKSMDRAPRISEEVRLYPHEVEEKVRDGLFLDAELGAEPDAGEDKDFPRTFIEQHRRWDLDGDGYSEPYIVTVHKSSGKVVRVTARYDAEGIKVSAKDTSRIVKIDAIQHYTKFDFMPSLDGGIYGTGFGQLLQPINKGINTTLNMMLDAGHLQVVGGGFIGKGVSMHSGSIRFKPAEWKILNTPGSAIRDAIVPIPANGPNAVLFQLLGLLIDAGKEMAASNDVLEGSSNMANMQPTTMLALIEQGLKVFKAIYKRIYRSLKEEFEKLYRLNRVYLPEISQYEYGGQWFKITREDYLQSSGVCPYSDPEMVSDMQKLGRAQFLLAYKDDPRLDGAKILQRAFDAASIERGSDLFAPTPQPDPMVMAMMAETDAKIGTERSKQIQLLADAVWKLAQADAKETDQDMAWVTTQLDALRLRMEALNGKAGPDGQHAPPNQALLDAVAGAGAGDDDGKTPTAGPGGDLGAPPVPGARKAKDGKWYLPDPERPGKFLMVGANG